MLSLMVVAPHALLHAFTLRAPLFLEGVARMAPATPVSAEQTGDSCASRNAKSLAIPAKLYDHQLRSKEVVGGAKACRETRGNGLLMWRRILLFERFGWGKAGFTSLSRMRDDGTRQCVPSKARH